MKLRHLVVSALALAIVLSMCANAFAADSAATSAAPAAGKDTSRKDAAKPALRPAEALTKSTIKGKIASKMVTVKKTGKERKVFTVTVTEAKDKDGKSLRTLKGKTLAISGRKPAELEKFVGKDAEITGDIRAKRIKAESIK